MRTRKWVYLVHGGELQGPCRVHVTLNASLAQQALSQCCSAVRRGNTKQCKEMEVWCNGVCNAWTVWCFWCTWCIMAFVVYASEPAGMNIQCSLELCRRAKRAGRKFENTGLHAMITLQMMRGIGTFSLAYFCLN